MSTFCNKQWFRLIEITKTNQTSFFDPWSPYHLKFNAWINIIFLPKFPETSYVWAVIRKLLILYTKPSKICINLHIHSSAIRTAFISLAKTLLSNSTGNSYPFYTVYYHVKENNRKKYEFVDGFYTDFKEINFAFDLRNIFPRT